MGNYIVHKHPETYLINNMLKQHISDMIQEEINNNYRTSQSNGNELLDTSDILTLFKKHGGNILTTNRINTILDKCNAYNSVDVSSADRTAGYLGIFENFLTKEKVTLKEAIDWYKANKDKQRLFGMLLVNKAKDIVLSPLNLFDCLCYMKEYEINPFDLKYTAIFYSTKRDRIKTELVYDINHFSEEDLERFIANIATSAVTQAKLINDYDPVLLQPKIDSTNVNLSFREIYKKMDELNSGSIYSSSYEGLVQSTMGYSLQNKSFYVKLPKSENTQINTYLKNYSDNEDTVNSPHQFQSIGCLCTSSGLYYPYYGLALSNSISNNSFNAEGIASFTPFITGNIQSRCNPIQSELDISNLFHSVCVGRTGVNDTRKLDLLARLHRLNGSSMFKQEIVFNGYMIYALFSIELSLKLWEKFYEKN